MKVLILGGFLGSGKTTLLLQIARDLAEHAPKDKECKVMILENEVGQEGIDDKLIRSNGYQVASLFEGCICCSLSGEVIPLVEKMRKTYDPDWLIIETTGLAYPKQIQSNLMEALHLPSAVCTVVDCSRWARFLIPMHDLLEGQIECADVILLNKCDLVDGETLQTVKEEVREFRNIDDCYALSALQPLDPEILQAIREVKCYGET